MFLRAKRAPSPALLFASCSLFALAHASSALANDAPVVVRPPPPPPPPPPSPVIAITSQINGRVASLQCGTATAEQPLFTRLAGSLQSHNTALLFDAGDLVGASALSRHAIEHHAPLFARAVHAAGFRALALGHRDLSAPRDELLAAARAFNAEHIPYVLSNLTCDDSAREVCDLIRNGVDEPVLVESPYGRVAFLAALTPTATDFIAHDRTEGLTLNDPALSLVAASARARAAGARHVIAVYDPARDNEARDALALLAQIGSQRGPDVLIVHRLSSVLASARGAENATRLVAARPGVGVLFSEGRDPESIEPSDVTPHEAVRTFTRTLHEDLCSNLARPLPGGQLEETVDRDRFGQFLLDVLRDETSSDVGILPRRTVAAPQGLFPMSGRLTSLQVTAALPFDNSLRVARIPGSVLKDIALSSQAERFHLRGIERDGNTIRINGRRVDEDLAYRVVTIDYVAEGGDGGLGTDEEIAWTPQGERTARQVFLAWLSRPRPNGALHAPVDPAWRTRWTFSSTLDLSFSATHVDNDFSAELTDAQLALSRALAFSAEAEFRANADHPMYALENALRLRYGVQASSDVPNPLPALQENTDLITERSTAILRRFNRNRLPIYVPRPYGEFFLESEFTRPTTRSFHHLELRPSAGVRFELWERFFLFAGGGFSWETMATMGDPAFPGLPVAGVLTAGWALRPGKIFSIGDRDITGESFLEAVWRDPAADRTGSGVAIRFRARFELPLLDWLSLSLTYDLFARSSLLRNDMGQLNSAWGVAGDLTAGLQLSIARAVQAFTF